MHFTMHLVMLEALDRAHGLGTLLRVLTGKEFSTDRVDLMRYFLKKYAICPNSELICQQSGLLSMTYEGTGTLMDRTRGSASRFTRTFPVAWVLTGLLPGAARAAADSAGVSPVRAGSLAPDVAPYQGMFWLLIALLLVQSMAVALLLRKLRRQREAQELLRGSEERFRMLVENSMVASYLIDQDEIIQYANRTLCAMFGYQQEDVVGKMGFGVLIAPGDLPRVTENLGKRVSSYEACGVHRNGEPIDLEILGWGTSCAGRRVVVGSLLDISPRKRMESQMQLERLQREELNRNLERSIREQVEKSREKDRYLLQQSRFAAMGEMISNIAHQWRQPLNKLGIVMQRMQMEQEKGVMTDGLMEERVGNGMELLLGLSLTIDDFRNFFRPEAEPAPFSLSGAVRKTVSFFEASCLDHDIKIGVVGDSNLVYNGHVVEFRQALLNILNNARDALLENKVAQPTIVVGMRDEEHRSVLTVRDNAGGIDPEIIDKIFDPYFTTKGLGNRTGIGLYMAKTIIDQNMGRILVRNLEDGAEFRIVV